MKRLSVMLAGSALLLPCLAQAQSVEDRARSAAQASQTKTGDSDTLLKNYVTPGMSGQPVTTIDGNKSFTPTLACQKTAKLLEVLIQPSATGDIGLVQISRDKDLNGSFDTSSTLPVPVSGICANGVISCNPGTWDQCRSFRWDLDSSQDLKLTAVDMPELAGCYCINNSCGSNLVFGNLSSVLKDLGGGMVGALTTADPRIGVAEALISGPVIDYVGAQTTACSANPVIGQTAYKANPTAIQGDAFALSSTNPVFQALAASSAGAGKAEQQRACSVTREVTVKGATIDDVISRTSGGYSTVITSANSVDFVLGSPATHSLRSGGCGLFDFRMTLNVADVDRLISVTLPTFSADDWAQVRIDGNLVAYGPGPWTGSGYPPGGCERNGTTSYAPGTDLMPWFTQGSHEVWLRVAVADKGNGVATIRAVVDTSCKMAERVVDLCSGYGADPKCHLAAEQVDGVETFRNGVATGLRPLPQTRIVGTASCALQLTRDFFERDRSYACITDSASLPELDLSRGAYIIDHSTETLLADRTTAADGSVCPAGPGEEIVSACGCLDDFPEAAVMMQTVRLGGADMTCTSATP